MIAPARDIRGTVGRHVGVLFSIPPNRECQSEFRRGRATPFVRSIAARSDVNRSPPCRIDVRDSHVVLFHAALLFASASASVRRRWKRNVEGIAVMD